MSESINWLKAFETSTLIPLCLLCGHDDAHCLCKVPKRPCAICDNYIVESKLIDMTDGRKVCPRCREHARQIAEQRSKMQASLF